MPLQVDARKRTSRDLSSRSTKLELILGSEVALRELHRHKWRLEACQDLCLFSDSSTPCLIMDVVFLK